MSKKTPFKLMAPGAELIVKRSVDIDVPCDDGFEEQTLSVRWKILDEDEIQAVVGSEKMGKLMYDKETMDRLLAEVIVDLPDLTQDTGETGSKPVEFSSELVRTLLAKGYVRTALIADYFATINGRAEKNSGRSRG